MYLHELADQEASFTKEEMQTGKHTEYEKRLIQKYLEIISIEREKERQQQIKSAQKSFLSNGLSTSPPTTNNNAQQQDYKAKHLQPTVNNYYNENNSKTQSVCDYEFNIQQQQNHYNNKKNHRNYHHESDNNNGDMGEDNAAMNNNNTAMATSNNNMVGIRIDNQKRFVSRVVINSRFHIQNKKSEYSTFDNSATEFGKNLVISQAIFTNDNSHCNQDILMSN